MPDEGVAAELLAQPRDRELGDVAAAPAAQSNQPADPQIRHPGDMERDHARRLRHSYPTFLFCSQYQDATAGVIVKPDAGLADREGEAAGDKAALASWPGRPKVETPPPTSADALKKAGMAVTSTALAGTKFLPPPAVS
jgi:hypothetical protein